MYHINHMVDMKLTEDYVENLDPREYTFKWTGKSRDNNGMFEAEIECELGSFWIRKFPEDLVDAFEWDIYEEFRHKFDR